MTKTLFYAGIDVAARSRDQREAPGLSEMDYRPARGGHTRLSAERKLSRGATGDSPRIVLCADHCANGVRFSSDVSFRSGTSVLTAASSRQKAADARLISRTRLLVCGASSARTRQITSA